RLRGDFAAVGLLVTAVMFNLLVTNYTPLLDGAAGLSLVPSPLQSVANPQSSGYQWGYGIVALLLAFLTYVFVTRLTNSPYGRTLRAMRDNDIGVPVGRRLRRPPPRLPVFRLRPPTPHRALRAAPAGDARQRHRRGLS